MTFVESEIDSQPDCWARAAAAASTPAVRAALPGPGERVAAIGCGTSWFMAMAYARLRQHAAPGGGPTEAYPASELPPAGDLDRIVAITRSGTTTEVCRVVETAGVPVTVLTADPAAPAARAAPAVVDLPFADERSVVQTRFATSVLALLRAHLGADLDPAIGHARQALTRPLPMAVAGCEQVTFLGRDWTVGLAHEAALKCREAARLWTESYPAMDYRHGPIAIAEPGRAVWLIGETPAGLAGDVRRTGAAFLSDDLDPMASLVLAQRFAVALARHRDLDPDRPRHLSRAVVLEPEAGSEADPPC